MEYNVCVIHFLIKKSLQYLLSWQNHLCTLKGKCVPKYGFKLQEIIRKQHEHLVFIKPVSPQIYM